MPRSLYFDDAIPEFVQVLSLHLAPQDISEGVIVRDVVGRLAFTSASPLPSEKLGELNNALAERVGRYARLGRAARSGVRDGEREEILDDPDQFEVTVGGKVVRLVDRRLSGGDWLRASNEVKNGPPVVVFASMKGGVGRSTALVVSALDLAASGRRVLVLDLDLEAPGLGALLLKDEELPEFGVIDALVERKLGAWDDAFVRDLVSPAPKGGGGLLVCPALGARSVRNPAGVLSKLGRIYGEAAGENGASMTMLDQLVELVEHLARVHRPDVFLVDARAGLHELTASTIQGLGDEVLLFGLDEPQTWQSYRVLLAQLAASERKAGWRARLTPVQGKAPADRLLRERYLRTWRDLFGEWSAHPAKGAPSPSAPGDQYDWDEDPLESVEEEDPIGLSVLFNSNFMGYRPLDPEALRMDEGVTRATFGEILDHVRSIVEDR